MNTLYNVEQFAKQPGAQVLICGSMAGVEATQKQVAKTTIDAFATTWAEDGIDLTDLAPLSGHPVALLTNEATAQKLTEPLIGIGVTAIKFIPGPAGAGPDWDIANESDDFDLLAHTKAHAKSIYSAPKPAKQENLEASEPAKNRETQAPPALVAETHATCPVANAAPSVPAPPVRRDFTSFVASRYADPHDVLVAHFDAAKAAALEVDALLEEVPDLDGGRTYLANAESGKLDQRQYVRASLVDDSDGTCWPLLTIGTFHGGGKTIVWKPRDLVYREYEAEKSSGSDLPAVDRRAEFARRADEIKAAAAAHRVADEEQSEQGQQAAARLARQVWDEAVLAVQHPYTTAKKVDPKGLRIAARDYSAELFSKQNREWQVVGRAVAKGDLLAPMYAAGELVNLQRLSLAKKLPLLGGRKKGVSLTLGEFEEAKLDSRGRSVIVVVEGVATGKSVHECTSHFVVVAFDAGSLLYEGERLRAEHAAATIVFAADNDAETDGNPGLSKARAAAEAVGGFVAVPTLAGKPGQKCDFNDLHSEDGPDAVSACIDALFKTLTHEGMRASHDDGAQAAQSTLAEATVPSLPFVAPAGSADALVMAVAAPLEGELNSVKPPVHDVHQMDRVNEMSWPHMDLKPGGTKPLNTIPNLKHLLNNYHFTVRYDVIRKELTANHPGQRGTPDNVRSKVIDTVLSLAALNHLPKSDVPSFLLSIGDDHQVNPVIDFITAKEWDGKSRFDELLASIKTKPGFDRELLTLLVRRWLTSAVAAAATSKGFWSKGVLVFQGDQSLGKTAWFRALLPMAMRDLVKVDAHIDPANKDTIISAVSHWLVELGELDGTLRKADIARLKGFISQDLDQFRRPYGRAEEKFQRRTVFFASVNPERFLADDTGNVRWWTVPVSSINASHNIDMQQLWAEVFTWFNAGERWWLDSNEETRLNSANADHEQGSPVDELITCRYDFAGVTRRPLTATQVLLELGYDNPNKKTLNESANVMRKHFGDSTKSNSRRVFRVPCLIARP